MDADIRYCKSTLYGSLGLCLLTFDLVNQKHGTQFDIFSVKDTTDAALVGSGSEIQEEDDSNMVRRRVAIQIDGALEGED